MVTLQRNQVATLGGISRLIGGATRWIPSERSKEQSGQTLLDTGQLAALMSFLATATGVTVGTNKAYAAIHHFGGQAGKNKALTLPARPYLVNQEEDLDEIEAEAEDFFRRTLA